MNSMIETKAALCGCSCPSQVESVVDAYCDQVRFDYSHDLSIMDNAVIASRQGKNKIANVLCFADQQMRKVRR